MKDEKKNRRKVLPEGEQKNKKVKKIDPKDQQEQEQLFLQANAISPANKKIDKEEIKFETRGGDIINIDEKNHSIFFVIHFITRLLIY